MKNQPHIHWVLTALLVWVGCPAFAIPPRPDLISGWDRQTKGFAEQVRQSALQRGLDRGRNVLPQMRALRRDDSAQVTLRVPVILVDFADNQADRQNDTAGHYNSFLFTQGEFQTGSLQEYYLENSRGVVTITGEVVGWYRAPQNYSYYVNGQYGLGNYPRNSQRLAEDAIHAADGDIDYSRYDNDGDGVVDALFIVHAGGGAEEDPNNVNKIWSHAWNVQNMNALDGTHFDGYTMVPEDGRVGVFAHELGHALSDLPDLYDTQGNSMGLGIWSLMAYGSWGDDGWRPAHFDAWCLIKLGFAQATSLPRNRHTMLSPVETTGSIFRLWNPDRQGSEYFLAEYRDRSGFDSSLPGPGLIIYHVDDRMDGNDNPWWPDQQGNRHYQVAVEQADGHWNLERGDNPGDAGDPFPGSSDNQRFDADTQPGSLDYIGQATNVAVRNIQVVDGGIEADWVVGVQGPRVIIQTVGLAEGWNIISLRVTPPSLDVHHLFAPLTDAGELVLVKDAYGAFYAPGFGFSNLSDYDVRQGYFIKVTRDTELQVEGEEIAFDTPIPLQDGWQMVAYYPDYSLTPQVAFGGLGDSLVIAKDANGLFYLPRIHFSNMNDLQAGQGYYIRVNGNGQLIYPAR